LRQPTGSHDPPNQNLLKQGNCHPKVSKACRKWSQALRPRARTRF
jgi:hypothetical protein